MGFCRRCGEIVPGKAARCKCGGSAVAPVVRWNQTQKEGVGPDRWAKTYVSTTADKVAPSNVTSEPFQGRRVTNGSPTKSARRFPRPLSTIGPNVVLPDNRVTHHIDSVTSLQATAPTNGNVKSFLKGSPGSMPADVIASPSSATLSKAYGSILQSPETLPIHSCARCSTIFPPDATIYPDPLTLSDGNPSFLCRPCFAVHGGSKGDCASCGREVLTATTEGGFIENSGKVWHKRCFRCEGCNKDISRVPMVDLYGKPSCSECFDSCVDRNKTPKRQSQEHTNNLGGMGSRSRESSPVIEELSERLGIRRGDSPQSSRSPSSRKTNVSQFLLNQSIGSCEEDSVHGSGHPDRSSSPSTPPREGRASELASTLAISLGAVRLERTTDDIPDVSSSVPLSSTPPVRQPSPTSDSCDSIRSKGRRIPSPLKVERTGEGKCAQCLRSLFSISSDRKIVTVPANSPNSLPIMYHASCFRCHVCGETFDGDERGRAKFVRDFTGVCHPECKPSDTFPEDCPRSTSGSVTLDHNIDQPPKTAPPFPQSSTRFGGSKMCPGCHTNVSLMEYGVVPGPQNSRWHIGCLVCGGKGAKLPRPGCGKKLDSGARMDHDGKVWCRECTLLLPGGTSPTRGRLMPSYTGTRPESVETGRLFGQVTGTLYGRTADRLAGQCTGGDFSLMRGGSISPTRQMTRSVSPTKALIPVTRHSRPAGTWRHKSVDEGRGMFLVKQITGTVV